MGSGRPELLRAGGETLDCSPCRPGPGATIKRTRRGA